MLFKKYIQSLRRYFSNSSPWLTGGVAALLSVGILHIGYWERLEQIGYKYLFKIREIEVLPEPKWDERIAVIAIDEASLQKYGQFPWQRIRYVQLLQALQKAPPAAIGFDIKFIESSPFDDQFAQAIATNGNVVLARAWDERGNLLEPNEKLAEAAANQGHIYQQVDSDGITRKATIWMNGPEDSQVGLGPALIQVYNLYNPNNPIALPEPVKGQELQNVWINWPGEVKYLANDRQIKSPPTYSFVDVVEGRFQAKDLANKFVLVGFTATALADPLRTPYNRETPTYGVYFHAAVIDNLLNDRLLQKLTLDTEIWLLILLGPVTSWLLFYRDLKGRIALAILLPITWLAIAAIAFSFYQWWIPIAAPLGTMLLAGVGVQLWEQYEKQQLMNLFEKHVAPETANLIWQRKDEIIDEGELEAQELTATVLFMDIRGFTTISERLSPRELLSWLNQYLNAMTECIMDRGGVVDKYIGDAIMAVFGVPFPRTQAEEIKQDAMNAIAASFAMHERLKLLNEDLNAQKKPLIQFGIGIHTGPLIAGSVGCSRRLNYSVIGDTVNVAARLESMNKELTADKPYKILLTGETFDYVSDRYLGQQVTTIQLRGRQQETMIYTILGQK
ncbi:CHASE2 domain-containing protein [Aerosakkonema sp. BLCC-F183]|uniref:CHASE2 domain-containing protein n=1 Tax=Aerosakkonema sp. BLCC-F183 TaxID=3342834 RepID=UPI0035B9AE0E